MNVHGYARRIDRPFLRIHRITQNIHILIAGIIFFSRHSLDSSGYSYFPRENHLLLATFIEWPEIFVFFEFPIGL